MILASTSCGSIDNAATRIPAGHPSLLLRNGSHGLQDWQAAVWGASLRAGRVMQAMDEQDPTGLHRLYRALTADGVAAFHAGRPPFADLAGALNSVGLPSAYAGAADDTSRDDPIRRAMAEASAAIGEGVGTPALVLRSDRPVGVLGPVVSGPLSAADALRLWDAVEAFTAVPALFELSRPRPPGPAIPSDERSSPPAIMNGPPDRQTTEPPTTTRGGSTGAPAPSTAMAKARRAGPTADHDGTLRQRPVNSLEREARPATVEAAPAGKRLR